MPETLTARRASDVIGCLDFGTAFSKVAIVDAEAIKDLDESCLHPLPIGRDISNNPFLLPSMVFITDDAILFGREAERAARRNERNGRSAFQSPKQYLSTHALSQFDELLDGDIDPTNSYTARQIITVYLAFLLERARVAAERIGQPWPVKLRVTRPAWKTERAEWGEKTLRSLVRNAFKLADGFRDQFLEKEGLAHTVLREALDAVSASEDRVSDDLIFELSDQDTATMPEATAVAAGSIRPKGRRVIVVADIGGGTSDFAAFMTGLPGKSVVAELEGSARVVRQAGDYLDMQLRRLLLQKAGMLPDDPSARGPAARLLSRQRELKEVLFSQGSVVQEVGDFTVKLGLDEFLGDQYVREFSNLLIKTFNETLDVAIECAKAFSSDRVRTPVQVMATGGGSQLPMVDEMIASATHSWSIERIKPETLVRDNDDLKAVLPQLTVSIGGAVRDLPKQTAPIRG